MWGGGRDGLEIEEFLSPDSSPEPGQAGAGSLLAFHLLEGVRGGAGRGGWEGIGGLAHHGITFTLHLPAPSLAASLR